MNKFLQKRLRRLAAMPANQTSQQEECVGILARAVLAYDEVLAQDTFPLTIGDRKRIENSLLEALTTPLMKKYTDG